MEQQRTGNGYQPLLSDLSDRQAEALCQTLRAQLIEDVSVTGGHLASNLGVVELTVAIHRVFDTATDRLVFDVGHQCYLHKMITGRQEAMGGLRQMGGIAGFPKPAESVHDAFIAGHASNSVSVALGMARARAVLGEDYSVLALIGDGALTGGLAYEGLSNAGSCGQQLLVILNDNGMSITQNVGAVSDHLARQRLKPQYIRFKKWYRSVTARSWLGRKVYRVTHGMKRALKQSLLPCSMFENMGFNYLGPINGHDLSGLTRALRYAKELKEPVLLHVRTVKGKGYSPAEENPDAYHGVSPFDPACGVPAAAAMRENFSAVAGRTLLRLARKDRRVCAITAAMMGGTGLSEFAAAYPERFFDVGIAEGCAVSMAAGMAKQGAIPVFAVYSTFLQRSYDMLLHDVALEGLHVVLAVDRAGLVGEDGETHHGVFDCAYLDTVPGMTVLCPSNYTELDRMLEEAVLEYSGPVAVRYPRGTQGVYQQDSGNAPAAVLRRGGDLCLIGYGTMINTLLAAADQLEQNGVAAEVVKLNIITPFDIKWISGSLEGGSPVLVVEDSFSRGSVGERIASAVAQEGMQRQVVLLNSGSSFVTHGAVSRLDEQLGIDARGVYQKAMEVLGRAEEATGCGDD